jgi:hypothetical protein
MVSLLEIAGISFQLALSMGASHVDDDGNAIEYNKKLTMFKALLISLFTSLEHPFLQRRWYGYYR